MNEPCCDGSRASREIRGVQTVLATVGGVSSAAVNTGQIYVGLAPHEERVFSIGRLVTVHCSRATPARRFAATTPRRT